MIRKSIISLFSGLILSNALFAQTLSVSITSDAVGNTICSGTSVTFTATPTGTSSPLYRWKKNGTAVTGATSSTYTTTGLANNDVITVDLTEGSSNIVTSNLVLHLDAGQSSSYPGTGSTWTDLSGNGNHASLPSALVSTYSSSIGGGSFQFQNNSIYPIQSSAMTNWDLSSTNALSVETWVKETNSGDYQFWFSTPDLYYRLGNNPSGNLFWDMAHYTDRSSSNNISAGVWHHVVYTAGIESGNITTRVYIDGVFATSQNEGVSTLSSFTNYLIGTGQNIDQHRLNAYMGLIRVYNKALSVAEVAQNYNAQQGRFAGAVTSNSITTTVIASNTITLGSAAGTNAQTLCTNTAITNITYTTTGATGATFSGLPAGVTGTWSGNVVTISGTPTVAGSYSYTVTLTGGCGNITASGSITVATSSISITSSDADNSICNGAAVTFSTTVQNGGSSPTYQWYKNGAAISGATSSTYSTSTLNNNDAIYVSYASSCTTGSGNLIQNGLIQNLDAGNLSSYSGSGSTLTDLSGNGNNGTITGATYNSSGALSYFNNFGNISAPLTKTASMTFNVWAKTASVGNANMMFNAGNEGSGPDLWFINNGVYWNIWDSYGTPFLTDITNPGSVLNSTTIVTDPNMHNYTVVVDAVSNNAKLYFDGVLKGTSAYHSPAGSTTLSIGNGYGVWNGGIASFQTYNRTLSATEVANNYNAIAPKFQGIIISNTIQTTIATNNTILLASAAGTNAQTLCNNTAITNITYSTTGATGASFSGLPAGVNGAWSGDVVTISGNPTVAGSYSYAVTLTGGCGNITASGTITVNAVPALATSFGNALNYNSSEYAMNNSVSLTPSAGFTIEGWINPVTGSPYYTIANYTLNNKAAPWDMYFTENSTLIFWVGNGSNISSVSSDVTISTGVWTHIACVYDPTLSQIRIYINGVLHGSGSVNNSIVSMNPSAQFMIGSRYDRVTQMKGSLDDVRVWNVVRTATHIQSNMNNELIGNESGLIAYYTFNQGVASGNNTDITMASDNTSNNYNATLYGFTKNGATSNFIANSNSPGSDISTSPQTVCQNGSVTSLSISITGSYTYQWYSNTSASNTGGTIITGANLSSYTPSSATAGTRYYYVVVTNSSGCSATSSVSGAINVTANNTITLTSAAGTIAQTLCNNTTITNITYSTTGATGASVSGLPTGVSGAWSDNVVSISGTPTVANTYTYTVSLTGGCVAGTATGTVLVNPPSFTPATRTVAELQATGTNIKWYASASGGTALSSATVLANGHYYASQTVNGVESTTRTDITVTLDLTPCAPTATTPQSPGAGATVAALTCSGQSIRWYTAATGGTALPASTALLSGTHTYYASQTVSCTESASRVAVVVTLP